LAKLKTTLWLDAETDRALRDLAAAHHVTVSEAGAELLRRALKDRAASLGVDLLLTEVRRAVRGEVRALGNRLAHLLARTAVESIAGRRELYNLLARLLDAQTARAIHEGSWKASVDSLRHPLEELRQALSPASGDSVAPPAAPEEPQ